MNEYNKWINAKEQKPEPLDDGWLKKEIENIELNMSLEDAYRHIKSGYIHHMHERNAVFLPKAELIALMCIKKVISESKENKKIMDEYVNKSAVQQMLHEAYADDVLSTKDGCRALYKRLEDMPAADVQPVKHSMWRTGCNESLPTTRFVCSECDGLVIVSTYRNSCMYNYCPNCGARMDGENND